MVLVLGLVLAFSVSAGATTAITAPPVNSAGAPPTRGELAIVRAMNVVRARSGVRPLSVGRALTRAARSHSVDMARRGYFDHGPFVQRLRRYGVHAPYLGENLASGTQPLSAVAIVQMWIASPPHRQNLLDPTFNRIGIGVAGGSTRFVTADFAGR
ncbi:MAG: CAP domain-containing protein [Actinomycetota bacterium]